MKLLKDPKIEVDRRTAKIIAETICAEIDASRNKNKKYYERAKRCENQYNQITKWMEKGIICNEPWKNGADYFVPLTEWIIDAVWSRAMNILFSQEPYMTAIGVEAADVDKADGVTDFVDMVFREIVHLYDNFSFFLKQIIKLPFAVCKYDWVQDYDKLMMKESAQVFVGPDGKIEYLLSDDPEAMIKTMNFMANGYQQQPQTEEVWTTEDKELINAPQLRYLRFVDYVWSPNAKRDTRLYWEGDRVWYTLNELRLKAADEKFDEESVREVIKSQGLDDKSPGSERAIAAREALIESYYWFGRMPFNKQGDIDFEDPEALEQEVVCQVAFKEKELLQIHFWPHSRLPWPDRVYIRGEFEETEEFSGRSLAEKLYMCQKELNTFRNILMNNAMIAMQKVFVKRRTLTGEDWEKPILFPGAIWEEDQVGDIRALQVGDVASIGLELEQTFLNFAERVSNVSIFQTGTVRQEGGQKTLGEIAKTIEEGNIGLDKFIQKSHLLLRKICKWTVDYYHDRMPEGLERKIRGENSELIFPTKQNMAMYRQKGINPQWTESDIAGQFDFIWKGTSLSADKKWRLAIADDMMARYLPHPMIANNMLATWEILKEGLIARGKKDWQKILPQREAIIAEMQRMQQETQAKQTQNKMPSRIVQKLISKGMGPKQAMQMVKQGMGQGAGPTQ